GAAMNEGARSAALGVAGAPGLAEEVHVARDLLIARESGKAFHLAHLSTATSLELVRFARGLGARVTCEATPHHLLLDDGRIAGFRADAKVNPPLRGPADVAALRAAVRDGTIDVLASDHAPHAREEKELLLGEAPFGFSGLECALGAYALALAELPLARFVELCSTNPARILGVAGGSLRIGTPADLTIFADRSLRVETTRWYSRGKNSPFEGMTLPRRALATIVGGRLLAREGALLAAAAR
ncbi:MAG: amidohydrolase family protein, partial [Candidatus Dormibacteria bacterium]